MRNHAFIHRPVVAIGFVVVVLGICIAGAIRIDVVEDITALLPEASDSQRSLLTLARQAGLMEKVVVILGPDDGDIEQRHGIVDELTHTLKGLDGVRTVVGQVDPATARRAAEVILSHAPRLYKWEGASLTALSIEKKLQRLKKRLAVPEAMVMQPYLLKDPLGLAQEALQHLEIAGQALGARIDQGHLVSADQRYSLVVLEIDFNPLDVSRAEGFIADLDEHVRAAIHQGGMPDLSSIALGGVHYVVSSARAIRADVRMTVILTIVLVLLVFWAFFRNIRLLPAALLPGGIGMGAAIGVLGLAGVHLHALTLGFAAAVTGISVDYAIHLLHRGTTEPGNDTTERMTRALGAVTRPVVLGCLTTFAAFILIAFSNFTGIRQLAIFSAISVPVAMAATLYVLPVFHTFLLGARVKKPRAVLATKWVGSGVVRPVSKGTAIAISLGFLTLLVLGLIGASRVSLSGDPRDLKNTDPGLAQREAVLKTLFPGLASRVLLVATGPSLEAALQANDALYRHLLAQDIYARDIVSVSPFVPSMGTQAASLGAVRQLFEESEQLDLKQLFLSAGFTPEYVAAFRASVEMPAIDPTTYRDTALAEIIDDAVGQAGGQHYVLTWVRAADDGAIAKLSSIAAQVAGCALISERLEAQDNLRTLQRELIIMLATWLCAAFLLVSISERSPAYGFYASLPAIFGMVAALGVFGYTGRALTPVASAGLVLVMGLGIDYGIFMRSGHPGAGARTATAVFASALTTLAAFGVLTLAQTRAMADMGLIILVGVIAALATALVLLPACTPRNSA
ncbi:MAG: MMPL family transporter [Myxococcota bacterium]|nr:MMPL family transporter [Myxococcota bacterium]